MSIFTENNEKQEGFNVKKFNETCEKVLKAGKFLGRPVISKTDVYGELADRLGVSTEYVSKWACKNSKGPRDRDVAEGLENLLGVSLWGEYSRRKYSQVTQNAIASIYGLVEQYFAGNDYEDEDKWAQTMAEIRKFELAIPEEEYKKITDFLDENVADLVYDEETFAALHTEEYGEYCEDGSFSISDPTKFLARYFSIIMEKEEKFKNFMKENYAEALQA